MTLDERFAAFAPSTDKPSRERVDHANLDPRRRRGVHPRSDSASRPQARSERRGERAS